RYRRRCLDRRPRQLFNRSTALQFPVRRRCLLGNQRREETRNAFACVLPGAHTRLLAILRWRGGPRVLAAIRYHRRRQRRTYTDQRDQPWMLALALPPGERAGDGLTPCP